MEIILPFILGSLATILVAFFWNQFKMWKDYKDIFKPKH